MSDVFAGPPSDAGRDGMGLWGGGRPPPVLLAALGAAALIAVMLLAFFLGKGAGNNASPSSGLDGDAGAASVSDDRVVLKVVFEGEGGGLVQLVPPGVTCEQSCEREYPNGTRLTALATPDEGSVFEKWGDACSGTERCSVFMNRTLTLKATFQPKPLGIDPTCEDGQIERDGKCIPDGGAVPSGPSEPASDCHDGRDNDGDGLIDAEQDPGCEANSSEVGADAPPDPAAPAPGTGGTTPQTSTTPQTTTTPKATTPSTGGTKPRDTTTTPRRQAPLNDCSDGRDNDGDGLTDSAQDPNCTDGRSESG